MYWIWRRMGTSLKQILFVFHSHARWFGKNLHEFWTSSSSILYQEVIVDLLQGQMSRSWWLWWAMSATRLCFWPMAGGQLAIACQMNLSKLSLISHSSTKEIPQHSCAYIQYIYTGMYVQIYMYISIHLHLEGLVQQWGLLWPTLPKKRRRPLSDVQNSSFWIADNHWESDSFVCLHFALFILTNLFFPRFEF